MNARRNVPDCELPSDTAQRIRPASGFTNVPLSFASYRKKELMSRVAANPMPSTSGSFAMYCSSYRSAGLNPPFRQIRVASGVPGNGVVSQFANAQSVLRISTVPLFTPVALSVTADVSDAFVVSRVVGRYG